MTRDLDKYLTEKHLVIQNNYRTEDGKHPESCSHVACNVADILLENKQNPSLFAVRPVGNRKVVPKLYSGKISWGGHVVCVSDDKAHDPLIGKSIGIEEYKSSFEGVVELTEVVSSDQIVEFLQRGK